VLDVRPGRSVPPLILARHGFSRSVDVLRAPILTPLFVVALLQRRLGTRRRAAAMPPGVEWHHRATGPGIHCRARRSRHREERHLRHGRARRRRRFRRS